MPYLKLPPRTKEQNNGRPWRAKVLMRRLEVLREDRPARRFVVERMPARVLIPGYLGSLVVWKEMDLYFPAARQFIGDDDAAHSVPDSDGDWTVAFGQPESADT